MPAPEAGTGQHALPGHCLVSFFDNPSSTDRQHFVCSGVVVAPGWVLTVKHLFLQQPGRALWARPFVNALLAERVRRAPVLHPQLDAALVPIADLPVAAQPAVLSPRPLDSWTGGLALSGFHEGQVEHRPVASVLRRDAAEDHWLFQPKQPSGHSGSGLAIGGRLVGMAIAHYRDPNTNTGCALAISQLHDWLTLTVGEGLQFDPTRTTPDAGRPASLPRPDDDLAQDLVRCVSAIVGHAALRPNNWAGCSQGVPPDLRDALRVDPRARGELAVLAMLALGQRLVAAVDAEEIRPSLSQCRAVRRLMFDAMGQAARMCLDLAALPADARENFVVLVPALLVAGAALALRREPGKTWTISRIKGLRVLADAASLEVPVDVADGEHAVRDLDALVMQHLAPDEALSSPFDPVQKAYMRGVAHTLFDEGTGLHIVLRAAGAPPAAVVQQWAKHNRVRLVLLQPEQREKLFLYDEELLLAKIVSFIQLFNEEKWPAE